MRPVYDFLVRTDSGNILLLRVSKLDRNGSYLPFKLHNRCSHVFIKDGKLMKRHSLCCSEMWPDQSNDLRERWKKHCERGCLSQPLGGPNHWVTSSQVCSSAGCVFPSWVRACVCVCVREEKWSQLLRCCSVAGLCSLQATSFIHQHSWGHLRPLHVGAVRWKRVLSAQTEGAETWSKTNWHLRKESPALSVSTEPERDSPV